MKKRIFFVTLCMLLNIAVTSAEGLLGKQYAFIGAGTRKTGGETLKEIDESRSLITAFSNMPLTYNADFSIKFGYSDLKGTYRNIDADGREIDLAAFIFYHFTPLKSLDPYVGCGLNYEVKKGYLNKEDEWVDDEDKGSGPGLETGFQYAPKNDLSFKTYLNYFNVNSENDISINEFANINLKDNFGAAIYLSYFFDSEDFEISFGFTLDI